MIKIKGLAFGYNNHSDVLCGIDAKVGKGEVVSIIGPNGSGKTTLLRCINKILKPKKGKIMIQGKSVKKINLRKLSRLVSYVPQKETGSFPFTVFETILMGRLPYINWNVSDDDLKVVYETLHNLKLNGLRNRYIDELSGGEKQKVLIARALAQQPLVIILDEPTSNLDPKHQLQVFDLIVGLARKKGITIVCAIHDLHLAARFSDRIIMLKQGRVLADGPPRSVITPENMKEVYGIEAYICHNGGNFHVVPQRAL